MAPNKRVRPKAVTVLDEKADELCTLQLLCALPVQSRSGFLYSALLGTGFVPSRYGWLGRENPCELGTFIRASRAEHNACGSSASHAMAVYGVVMLPWSDAELDELIEDVLVDAYGVSEQLGSFDCVFAEAGLPVAAEALGTTCTLHAVEFDGDERRGLVAVTELEGHRHRLSLVDITITDNSHEAAPLLAAFRKWWVPPR